MGRWEGLLRGKRLYGKLGVDLPASEGIGVRTALVLRTEVGADVGRFKTEKHFYSWLAQLLVRIRRSHLKGE
jgi:hypothetical protein